MLIDNNLIRKGILRDVCFEQYTTNEVTFYVGDGARHSNFPFFNYKNNVVVAFLFSFHPSGEVYNGKARRSTYNTDTHTYIIRIGVRFSTIKLTALR